MGIKKEFTLSHATRREIPGFLERNWHFNSLVAILEKQIFKIWYRKGSNNAEEKLGEMRITLPRGILVRYKS